MTLLPLIERVRAACGYAALPEDFRIDGGGYPRLNNTMLSPKQYESILRGHWLGMLLAKTERDGQHRVNLYSVDGEWCLYVAGTSNRLGEAYHNGSKNDLHVFAEAVIAEFGKEGA